MAKKEVAPVKEDQLPATLEMSSEDLKDMYGDMGKEHVNIPRLVVLELLSPEVKQKLGSAGDFFVTGINKNLGKAPLEVVVLMRSFSRISWKALTDGGGIVCQAIDGKKGVGTPGGDCETCPQKEWHGKEKPKCDLYENFLVVLRSELQSGEAFPMALSGSRTKLKGLKAFNTLLMQLLQKRRPLFAKSYLIRAVPQTKAGNDYSVFGFSVGNDNSVLPEAEQKAAYELFVTFKGKAIDIQQEQEDSKQAETPSDAPAI